MSRSMLVLFMSIGAGIAMLAFFVLMTREDTADVRESSTEVFARENVAGGLNENACLASGGTWNACGSACRTTPEAPCIEVCVAYCECTISAQCPSGSSCAEVVDGVGVCR